MELHVMVGTVLGVIGLLYLVAFWGSALWKGIYSYLSDGDKEVDDLCIWLEDRLDWYGDYVEYGLLAPLAYFIVSGAIIFLTSEMGILLPIILGALLLVWLSLYILRGVIRLNKKLDKHSEDKNAHK